MKITRVFLIALFLGMPASAFAASVIASINGTPVTDEDVTARTKLMARQGKTSTNNRRVALQNIIDDNVKMAYAANFKALPSDADIEKELKAMKLGDMSSTERAMAKSAVASNIAWQIVVARTIVPTIEIEKEEVNAEKRELERAHGLPIEMTIVRLIGIPEDISKKLTKPKSCDDAMEMAEYFGGSPQKFTAAQYELSADIRERVTALPLLTWSPRVDSSVLLVCSTKKTSEYGKLDDVIKQNAIYKKAMFAADQQLKQLRRKAVIVINDDKYKL